MTRVVKPKSPEADCDGARKALEKELHGMSSKQVWGTSDVHSLRDLLKDESLSDACLRFWG